MQRETDIEEDRKREIYRRRNESGKRESGGERERERE